MESLVVSRVNNKSGFTLTEVILVLALISLVSFTVMPISIAFYRSQLLSQSTKDLEQVLRRAQQLSMVGKNDSTYGVRLLPDSYVLFAGDAYVSRQTEADEVYPVVSSLSISGPDEIVFSRIRGEPSEYEAISLALGNKISVIEIKPSGDIEF